MSERVQRRRTSAPSSRPRAEQALAAPRTDAAGLDALLDEIDTVLESDAEEYVRGFVQKGGQ